MENLQTQFLAWLKRFFDKICDIILQFPQGMHELVFFKDLRGKAAILP